MNTKLRIKILIDVSMTVLLMFLMSYMLAGPEIHEWMGSVLFLLFIAHHLLNLQWHKNLFRGKYTAYRTISLIIDVLTFIGMLTSMVTGIILSRYVFSWLNVTAGISLARRLHMLAAYWNYVLLSIHLGLHWSMIVGMVGKAGRKLCQNQPVLRMLLIWLFRACALVLAIYGGYQFFQQKIIQYLTGSVNFVFFDFRVPLLLFVFRYMAIMACIVFITYYIRKMYYIWKKNKR